MMNGRILAVWVGLLVATSAMAQFGMASSVQWRTFKRGEYSNIAKQSLFVLEDRGQFEQYWQNATGNPADTAPDGVDWLKDKLIAIHLGQRPTGGYKFLVRSVKKNKLDTTTISAIEQLPLPGSFVSQSVTSPYAIIKVPRTLSTNFALSVEKGPALSGGVIFNGGFGTDNGASSAPCSCCSGGTCTCPNCQGRNNDSRGDGGDTGNR